MRKKALVIDDEQIVLDSVSKILRDDHFTVDISLSGREGLDMAIKNQYDIVLTDIRMPNVGGMRVLRDIKRARPSLPVIMITGYASVQSAVQAMKLGATDYLEKPFTPMQLTEIVTSALEVSATQEPENQDLIHKEEIKKILDRMTTNGHFSAPPTISWVDTLDEYNLTGPEKLALLTGDIDWIEKFIGPIEPDQKKWLENRLSEEVW